MGIGVGRLDGFSLGSELLVGSETIRNTTLLQIIRCHFHSHLVAGKDVHAIDAHTSRQMAEKLVIFRLVADYLDAKGGIGKRLQDNADELNYIFRHKGQTKGNALGRAVAWYLLEESAARSLSGNSAITFIFSCKKLKMLFWEHFRVLRGISALFPLPDCLLRRSPRSRRG